MRISLVTLILLVITCFIVSCPGIGKKVSHDLPSDWPEASLTIHPDWDLKRKASAMHKLDPATYKEPMWLVAFDSEMNWQAVIDHVESCLGPQGYYRAKEKGLDNPLGLDLPEMRTYYSPNYLLKIIITDGVYFDDLASADVEFAMQIMEFKTPPNEIQVCLDVNKSRPGTKMGDKLLEGILEPIQ